MLATGGSAIKAVEVLQEHGVPEERIIFINLISSPEGLKTFCSKFPMLRVITGWIDEGLNEKAYIIPGLGDFGERRLVLLLFFFGVIFMSWSFFLFIDRSDELIIWLRATMDSNAILLSCCFAWLSSSIPSFYGPTCPCSFRGNANFFDYLSSIFS
jgi:hypothetical protein